MEVDGQADVKSELPTPPASDVGSPTSFSHCGSDSEPDSPMGEDTKVCRAHLNETFEMRVRDRDARTDGLFPLGLRLNES